MFGWSGRAGKDADAWGPHIQEMQQTADSITKTTGHNCVSLASKMGITKLIRLPKYNNIANGLFDYEIQADVQLLQDCIGFYKRYSPDLWQLYQVQWTGECLCEISP